MATLRTVDSAGKFVYLNNNDDVAFVDTSTPDIKSGTGKLVNNGNIWQIIYNGGVFNVDKLNLLNKVTTITKFENPKDLSFANQYNAQYSGIGNSNDRYVSSGFDNGYGGKRSRRRRKTRKSRKSRR
jgi:hypothetical protein